MPRMKKKSQETRTKEQRIKRREQSQKTKNDMSKHRLVPLSQLFGERTTVAVSSNHAAKRKTCWECQYTMVPYRQGNEQLCRYVCPVCSKRYIDVRYLKMHARGQTRVPVSPCVWCGKTFAGWPEKEEHAKKRACKLSVIQHQCRLCSRLFALFSEFKEHKCLPPGCYLFGPRELITADNVQHKRALKTK